MTTAIKYIILILIQLQYLVIPDHISHLTNVVKHIIGSSSHLQIVFFLPRLSNMAHNLTIVW